MTAISLQATQNDIIRQVPEKSGMTKQEVLAGLDEAFHELKMYREGKLELKPLEEVLDEL